MSVVNRLLNKPFKTQLLDSVSSLPYGLAGQPGDGFLNGIHLDFANDFHYIKVPGSDPIIGVFTDFFTFTGDNKSMYRGKNGLLIPSVTNTPRIEYDAVGNVLGLLVEGARTNLCLQSQTLQTSWSRTAINAFVSGSVVDAIAAPDGTTTADFLQEDNSAATVHHLAQAFTKAASALPYTITVWAKTNGRHLLVMFRDGSSASNRVEIGVNLTTGVVASAAAAFGTFTAASGSIASYGNGWYRVTLTGTTSTETGVVIRAYLDDGTFTAGGTSYSGDSASGLYLWGAQLEQASFPSSYIPTTTAGVARAADNPQRTVGAEWGVTGGTIYAEYDTQVTSDARFVVFDAGNGSERFALRTNSGGGGGFNVHSSSTDVSIATGTIVAGQSFKTAFAGADNNFAVMTTGGTLTTDTTGTLATDVVRLTLGYDPSGGSNLFGHIRRLDYEPTRLPNGELQRKTAA